MLFFTVCPIHQLAEALVLGDSIKTQSPHYQYIIGLIGEKTHIPKNINLSHSVVEVSAIEIPTFSKMCDKYTTDELLANTKPFFAAYFFKKFPAENNLVFFDATTLVFDKLDFINNDYSITLTPQITQANRHPDEKQVLNTGIFHAGFFALKRSDETLKFLDWWQKRVAEKGFINLCKGMNADQLWLEHVPIFFKNVFIEKHEGLNVGYWNVSERKVEVVSEGSSWLSNKSPLISYNFKNAAYWKLYQQKVDKYNYLKLKDIQPTLGIYIPKKKPTFLSKKLRKIASKIDELIDKII